MVRWWLGPVVAAVGAAAAVAAVAWAAPPSPSAAPPACPLEETAALSEVACEVGRALGKATGVRVVISPLASDVSVARARQQDLERAIAQRIATALAGRAVLDAEPKSLDAALDGAPGKVLHVVPSIRGGRLLVEAGLHFGPRSFWERLFSPRPLALRRVAARRPIDGEVQGYLAPLAATAPATEKRPHGVPDVVALACGEVRGGGGLDVVLVGRRRIVLEPLRPGGAATRIEAAWQDLAPIAPSPLREPIASAVAVPEKGVAVGSTDRARGVLLSGTLVLLAPLEAPVPWARVGCLSPRGTAVGAPTACVVGAPRGGLDVAGADAFASGLAVDRHGAARSVVAFRAGTGVLTLRDGAATVAISGVGTALAVGDVDRDGVPDIATSADTLKPAEDVLVVRSWPVGTAPVERYRVSVPDGVRAVAACPPDDGKAAALVVATSRELWILR